MSELSKTARAKMREKAHRICQSDPNQRVDASDYRVPGAENADQNTYPIQPKKRKYKRGGHVEGEAAKHHAGRKPRATGGRLDPFIPAAHTKLNPTRAINIAGAPPASGVNKLDAILGRQMRKDGGKVHSDEAEDRRLVRKMVKRPSLTGRATGGECVTDGEQEGTRPTGGREARKAGGRTKGKTNINIIISQPKDGAPPMGGMPMPPPRPPMPPMAPPGGGAPLGNPQAGGGAPPPMAMPQGRKRGGKVHLDAGSGSGLGRLEKAEAYGRD